MTLKTSSFVLGFLLIAAHFSLAQELTPKLNENVSKEPNPRSTPYQKPLSQNLVNTTLSAGLSTITPSPLSSNMESSIGELDTVQSRSTELSKAAYASYLDTYYKKQSEIVSKTSESSDETETTPLDTEFVLEMELASDPSEKIHQQIHQQNLAKQQQIIERMSSSSVSDSHVSSDEVSLAKPVKSSSSLSDKLVKSGTEKYFEERNNRGGLIEARRASETQKVKANFVKETNKSASQTSSQEVSKVPAAERITAAHSNVNRVSKITSSAIADVKTSAANQLNSASPLSSQAAILSEASFPFDFDFSPSQSDITDFDQGALTIVSNPVVDANNLSSTVGQLVRGSGTTSAGAYVDLLDPIDFTVNTTFTLKVLAPQVGTSVILKVENSGDPLIFFEQELFTNTANQWEDLIFDFSAIDTFEDYDRVVFVFDLGFEGDGSSNSTYYIDDLELVEGSSSEEFSTLPFDFESSPSELDIFGENGGLFSTVSNPNTFGINPSTFVGEVIKEPSDPAAGGTVYLTSPIDFSIDQFFNLKVLTPLSGTRVLLRVENILNPSVFFEEELTTTLGNEWEELTFDFSLIDLSESYDRVTFIFDDGISGDGTSTSTYYIDDLELVEGSSSEEFSTLPFDFESSPSELDMFGENGGLFSTVSNPNTFGINPSTFVGEVIKEPSDPAAGGTVYLTSPIDFSIDQFFNLKVLTPLSGTRVLLRVENILNPSVFFEEELTTTLGNEWEELTFDFSLIDLSESYDRVTFIFDDGISGDGTSNSTYYIDDLELVEVAPSPVSTLPFDFETSSSPAILDMFGFSGGSFSLVNNPSIGGINSSLLVGEVTRDFGETSSGVFVDLASPIDFSIDQFFNLKVFTSAVGTTVLLKVENGLNPSIFFEQELTTNTANEWEELTFDFSSIGLSDTYDRVTIVFDLGVESDGSSNATYYVDDLELVEGSSSEEFTALPFDFEFSPLEGDMFGHNGGFFGIASNPDQFGINTSTLVGEVIKESGDPSAGGTVYMTSPIDFSIDQFFNLKVLTPLSGTRVLLRVENILNPSAFIEEELTTTLGNEWEELTFDFSVIDPLENYDRVTFIFDDGIEGDGTSNSTYYIDDLELVEGSNSSVDIDFDDYTTLIELRDALGGDLAFSWSDGVMPSQWSNVFFDIDGKVVELYLDNFNLAGDIPVSFTTLDRLTFLAISNNAITSFPEGMSNLTTNTIYAANNQLSSLPSDMFAMSNLIVLDIYGNNLDENQFTSVSNPSTQFLTLNIGGNPLQSVPPIVYDLTSLTALYLSEANITSLDESIGLLENLEILALDNNALQSLPGSFSALVNLQVLTAGANQLETLPALTFESLRELRVWGNQLSLDISTFFALDSLRYLDVYGNAITGTLDGIGALPRLEELSFGQNQISGVIPSEISQLTELRYLYGWNNLLTGSLPSELFELPLISYIQLSENSFSGTFPETSGSSSLTYLDLSNNELSSLSPSIGNFSSLEYLNLSYNDFQGTLPVELASNSSLIEINLQYNEFNGSIPSEWGDLQSLVRLFLTGNFLSGELPDELGLLTDLNTLAIDQNQFTGDLPASYSNWTNLQNVYLYDNEITGLPDWSNLEFLNDLYLYNNRLEYDALEMLAQMSANVIEVDPQVSGSSTFEIVGIGTEVIIDATVGGSRNRYEWFLDGELLEGQESSTLIISDFSVDNAGSYVVNIYNDSTNSIFPITLTSGERAYWIIEDVSAADSLALVELYNATNGANWNNSSNWLKAPVVMWEGVILEGGRVTELDLVNQNLVGGIPPAIGELDALTRLDLWNNPEIENIAGELYGLSNLTFLSITNNGLTQLSPSIGLLTNLDTLWMGNNPFRGTVPKELFDLTNLRVLDMRGVSFTGAIPDELGNLTELRHLNFYNDSLITSIPNVFDQMPNLENLYLAYMDELVADIPSTITSLSNLRQLNLSSTPFTGGLEQVGQLTTLNMLWLYGSPLAATTLPSELSTLTNLETLGLGFTDYSGGIPEVIWDFERLKTLIMPESNINGPIPEGIANLDSLQYLNLRDNGFTGGFPEEFSVDYLERAYLYGNSLDDISQFESAPSLFQFFVSGNKLDFDDILPFESEITNGASYDFSNQQPTNDTITYIQLSDGESVTLSMNLVPDASTTIDWFQNGNYIGSGADLFLEFVSNPSSDGEYSAIANHSILTPLAGLELNSGIFDVQVVDPTDIADSTALVAFYNSVENASEAMDGWLSGPVETWPGVTAYGGKVRSIQLTGLSGTLAEDLDLSPLDALEGLFLTEGTLSGSIPEGVFNSSLIYLDLGRNELTGEIPTAIENSPNLIFLGLASNNLTGSIPDVELFSLSEMYLDNNAFSGAIPDWTAQNSWGGFSVDRNNFDELPSGLDIALENAFYVNFEYNNFDYFDLVRGSGNLVLNDASYGIQSSTREITWSGDASIGGSVTLSAERLDPDDQFNWFRYNKDYYDETAFYDFVTSTGTDSVLTLSIEGEYDQSNYLVSVSNPNYKSGGYEFLSKSIAVDPYEKRYATRMEASPLLPYEGGSDDGAVGLPDLPPSGWEWYETSNWWENPLAPDTDTLKLFFDEDQIPVNYIRFYGTQGLVLFQMTIHGEGGEELIIPVNSFVNYYDGRINFPKTSFAVSQIDLAVREGAIDAVEIGDTGEEKPAAPVLSDEFTTIGEDFIYIELIYSGLADYMILERSTDGAAFAVIDSVTNTGWYQDNVPPGKYFYRAKAVFESFGVESDYSDTLETGNCNPSLPLDKVWAGSSLAIEGSFVGQTGERDAVYITTTGYAEFQISDVTAGWYDWAFGFWEDPAFMREKCGDFSGNPLGSYVSEVDYRLEGDTLFVEWFDYGNDIHAISKFWVIGDAPVGNSDFEPSIPENLQASLFSSEFIELTWDGFDADAQYIIQRSVDNSIQYATIDTVSTTSYADANSLDGRRYFYRVIGLGGTVSSFPSNEAFIVHKGSVFEPVSNAVTTDITRTSYGGSWGDFDGDGDDDLYVTNAFEQASNFLYENTGNATFQKIIGSIATSQQAFTRSSSWGDYNNDGFLDLLLPSEAGVGNVIYSNTGSKSFVISNTAVTEASKEFGTESAIWVDLDNDGNLDIVNTRGQVFMNNDSGELSLATLLENLEGPFADNASRNWTVSNVDIDNDGDQDIYITSDFSNMFFVNDGLGALTFVTNEISNSSLLSRGFTWADFNNDGYIDLLTGDRDTELFGIYLNNGDGTFEFRPSDQFVVNSLVPIEELFVGRGYSAADFDNDGNMDIIGMLDNRARILYNNGNAEFTMLELTDQSFPLTNQFSHISLADVNGDGAMDVFLPNQDFNGQNYMYLSNDNSNNWLSIKLKGIESNALAIGARVKVKSSNVWQSQTVRSLNGISSGNSMALEFGLGSSVSADSVEVIWPSGLVTYNLDVPSNQLLSIVEIPEATGPTVNPIDSAALVALYNENGGVNWIRQQGWLVGSPLGWEGVNFNEDNRVEALILNDNNLSDTITARITDLSALQILDLSGNKLEGPLPSALGNLTGLVNLSLNDNQLDGTIPSSVGSLVNLENLDLYNNTFFGELPRTLGGLVELRQFEIQNNGFIGFVPAEIGTLSNLQVLRLDYNDFEGPLPVGLGGMSSLQVLYVNDNNFSESFPVDLGNISSLLELRAQNNNFFGPLPQSLANLEELQYVDLSNNAFTGSIAPLALAPYIYYFNADHNRFSELPDLNFSSADSIFVRNNAIDFGGFELNNRLISNKRLFLIPQDSLFEPVDTLQIVGEELEIFYALGGTFNSYQWMFNGEPLSSSDNVDIFESSVVLTDPDTPDQGIYVLEITNSNYPEVTLYTSPYNVKISSLQRDKEALLAFMESVNQGEFPVTLNWDEASELTSDWTGVTVEGDRVTELILPATIDADLTDGDQSQIFDGLVPLSFSDLSGLQTLDLKDHFLRSFPNVSNWPVIETVDISNNRLAFQDIIPNVALGSKITYVPQRRYDVTEFDTIQAGDDKIVRINMSGTGLEYQWKFGAYLPGQAFNNDVSVIPDANSRVYQIENIDFDKMGTYQVDITHPSVPALTITSRNRNVMASTDIFGTAFADGQNTLLTDGEVILYRKTPEGPFVAEDTVLLDGGGEYSFNDVVLGDFVVFTQPDRELFENTIATYYEKADLYENATTLEVRNRVDNVDIEMVFYQEPEEPLETGADFDGLVETEFEEDGIIDEESGGRISARRKVKKAGCSMRRFVRSGRPEEDVYELYAYVESDDEGRFTFTDIEEGTYRLNIQYPGVPMDPDSDIEFIVGGDKENQQFDLVATITEDGIVVAADEVLFTHKPYVKDIQLYPNPTDDVMIADFLVYRRLNDLKLEVMDVKGVKLFEIPLEHSMGKQRTQIDLSNYRSGVYFMLFTDEAGTFRQQYKIGKK